MTRATLVTTAEVRCDECGMVFEIDAALIFPDGMYWCPMCWEDLHEGREET